jgi:transcriptional regulator with XRE-family HTH domain
VWQRDKGPLRDVLARNMRRLRAERGLSQEALAHECGINRTYLSGVERSSAMSLSIISPELLTV